MLARTRTLDATSRGAFLLALGLLAALMSDSVSAQTPDTSNWRCRRCPFRTGYEASYAAGASYLSDDAAHFGDATGYDKKGAYLNLDGGGLYVGDQQRIRWNVEDLGLDSRLLSLDGGRPGHFEYSAAWSSVPRREFDTTRTIFRGGGDELKLPNGWVRSGTTSGFTTLAQSLVDRDIKSNRDTLALGGRYLRGGFDFFADYRRTKQDGVGIQGAAYYANTSLLPRPFDYTTDELDLGLRRAGARSNVKVAYYGSFFDDASLKLTWQDPFTSAPGAEQAALARPPDSSFQQLEVSGDYRLARYGGTLSFSAARGMMEQDSTLLAYTTNPSLTRALPRSSLDGRVATTHIAVTSTLRPLRLLRLKAAYRYDERDNQTPVEEWDRVIADTFDSGELETNTPYSFKRSRLSLSANYDVRRKLRLSAGYDDARVDRDYQEVARQDESTGWGQFGWRPNGQIDLRARIGASKRDVNDYDLGVAQALDQNPLMRKYQLAYRYREFAEWTIAGTLPNRPLSLSATLRRANDSYTESQLGLLSSDDRRFAGDLTWSLKSQGTLYFTAARDQLDSEQAGSAQFGVPDWRATYADEFDSFTAGFHSAQLTERMNLGIDYTYGRGRSRIEVASRFPDLRSTLHALRLRFGYEVSERLTGSLQLEYQGFEAHDWSLQDVGVATLPNVLSLGAKPYDYDVFLIGIGVRYSLAEQNTRGSR